MFCEFKAVVTLLVLQKFFYSPSSNIVFRRKNVDGRTGRYVSNLVLRNTHKDEQLGFKIKTNNPSHYLIKPSTGFINASKTSFFVLQLLLIIKYKSIFNNLLAVQNFKMTFSKTMPEAFRY